MPSLNSSENHTSGANANTAAATGRTGKELYKHVSELAQQPGVQALAQQHAGTHDPSGFSRREFLKVMGASLALAGLTACRWPKEIIAPYVSQPEGRKPGVPVRYATAMELNGHAAGLLVTSYDGRPVKIEGNPEHPINGGGADALQQASVLEMYDPERSQFVRKDGQQATWTDFLAYVEGMFADNVRVKNTGERFAILSEATSSLGYAATRKALAEKFPKAQWFEYEPLTDDNEREGAAIAFNAHVRAHYNLGHADVVACFDADLLHSHPAAIKHAREYAETRRVNERGQRYNAGGQIQEHGHGMSRLYAVEAVFSITGANADHRLPVPSSQVGAVLAKLAVELFKEHKLNAPEGVNAAELVGAAETAAAGAGADIAKFAQALAGDIKAHPQTSVIAVGARQPAGVHALAHVINMALKNHESGVVAYSPLSPREGAPREGHMASIARLAKAIGDGLVDTLLILGGNPAYDAPADLKFAELLKKASTTIHLSLYNNETSRLCNWHLPRAHFLESWGDAAAYDGTICTIQPLIQPLYGGKTPAELLDMLVARTEKEKRAPRGGLEITRAALAEAMPALKNDKEWRATLHCGMAPRPAGIGGQPFTPKVAAELGKALAGAAKAAKAEPFELIFTGDGKVHDGRFFNLGWLLECPDFLTGLTWDNAAVMGTGTADKLGVKDEDVVEISVEDKHFELAVAVLPGVPDGSVIAWLGYGRDGAGKIGLGSDGKPYGGNAYALRTTKNPHVTAATINKTGKKYELALSGMQVNYRIDELGFRGRQIRIDWLVREANLAEYGAHPDFVKHRVHNPGEVKLWDAHDMNAAPHKWGMAIDLNTCTGCNSCVVACQAENNIPVVGKAEVRLGRIMHWIRIDRYFKGDEKNPQVAHEPIACVQCENAPCEQVCPVGATQHTAEGLNDMSYNRCIGTRYCLNNCPYKVRRFNWFHNWSNNWSDLEKEENQVRRMLQNPEVTLRHRGVMEKCTYCVQRIQNAKISAKVASQPLKDGDIVPACAQTCPSHAIVFGDLKDPNSAVSRLHANNRAYELLGELNTKPRTLFLARVRNPNPALDPNAGKDAQGHDHSAPGHSH